MKPLSTGEREAVRKSYLFNNRRTLRIQDLYLIIKAVTEPSTVSVNCTTFHRIAIVKGKDQAEIILELLNASR